MGTATNNRRLNNAFLSSSFPQEPRIRLPPEENGLMALDCGSIEYGRPVVCVAGTGRGADTVCILTPGYTASLFDTRVHEILCKPGLYTQEKTE